MRAAVPSAASPESVDCREQSLATAAGEMRPTRDERRNAWQIKASQTEFKFLNNGFRGLSGLKIQKVRQSESVEAV